VKEEGCSDTGVGAREERECTTIGAIGAKTERRLYGVGERKVTYKLLLTISDRVTERN